MARPSQIRRIIAELRHVLGPDVPAWEIVKLAGVIVSAHREPEAVDFFDPAARRSFLSLDVDVALREEHAWRLVNFERQQGMAFDDDSDEDFARGQHLLRRLTRG